MERRPIIKEGKPVIMDVDMSTGAAEEEGMVCGGSVKILLELV
jgi:xanthine/CO dehydrogenase XdhC/CoxF family maturation factor